jgi:hypothetical protein
MTFQEFQESTAGNAPPAELPAPLEALWWDSKGDWAKAHECAQKHETGDYAWVHAYLHRKEGENANAGYWYRRAGRTVFGGTLEEEWAQITSALLDR